MLVADDDPFISGMYKTKLNLLGYEVQVAENGEECLACLARTLPDILLLDVVMPKKDGFEVLSQLRREEKTKNMKVLLLTNLGQRPDIQRGIGLGADGYVIKAHFTPSEVVERIENVLAGHGV